MLPLGVLAGLTNVKASPKYNLTSISTFLFSYCVVKPTTEVGRIWSVLNSLSESLIRYPECQQKACSSAVVVKISFKKQLGFLTDPVGFL